MTTERDLDFLAIPRAGSDAESGNEYCDWDDAVDGVTPEGRVLRGDEPLDLPEQRAVEEERWGVDGDRTETRFFFVRSEIIEFATNQRLTRDELLLYLLHCRGYHPKLRASGMGENAAKERLSLTKKPWEAATEGLVMKGLIRQMPTVSAFRPRTVLGCPVHPFGLYRITEGDTAASMDRHSYNSVRSQELIKMPWRLIDGRDGMEPMLCEVQTKEGLIVLLTLYLLSSGDGLIPRGFAKLDKDMNVRHRLSPLTRLEDTVVSCELDDLIVAGLVFPACEDVMGGQVLRLFHPLEVNADWDEALAS